MHLPAVDHLHVTDATLIAERRRRPPATTSVVSKGGIWNVPRPCFVDPASDASSFCDGLKVFGFVKHQHFPLLPAGPGVLVEGSTDDYAAEFVVPAPSLPVEKLVVVTAHRSALKFVTPGVLPPITLRVKGTIKSTVSKLLYAAVKVRTVSESEGVRVIEGCAVMRGFRNVRKVFEGTLQEEGGVTECTLTRVEGRENKVVFDRALTALQDHLAP